MLLLKMITLILLLLIFVQDLRDRAVYWILFPALAALFLAIRWQSPFFFQGLVQPIAINLGFIALQLVILTLYFSVQKERWVNITTELLGLGDILFLVSVGFYLSVLNFLLFYVTSLSVVMVLWLTWQLVSAKKDRQVPLAGLQSLAVILLLACDWWWIPFDLTSDAWLLNLIVR